MEKKRLELIGITYNQIEAHVFAVILQEVGGTRRIPIIIGQPEAQAIECKLQGIKTPRPLTHDLLVAMMHSFGLRLKEVVLRKLPNGVFAGDMYMTDGEKEVVIDARSSDAIGVAVRVNAPLYTTEDVLKEAGFESREASRQGGFFRVKTEISQEEENKAPTSGPEAVRGPKGYSSMSDDELRQAMEGAVLEERYEEAARIKEEIEKRKKQQ